MIWPRCPEDGSVVCVGVRPVMSVGVQSVLSILASSRVCCGPLVRDGLQK